jgi:hypothetical protein
MSCVGLTAAPVPWSAAPASCVHICGQLRGLLVLGAATSAQHEWTMFMSSDGHNDDPAMQFEAF